MANILIKKQSLRQLAEQDPTRAQAMKITAAGLTLDYHNNPLTAETLEQLASFAKKRELDQHILDLINGQVVNKTEKRAAWHTALRDPNTKAIEVSQTLEYISALCAKLEQKSITDIVHIGLGGSFWGPKLVYNALQDQAHTIKAHFIAELDEAQLNDTLAKLNLDTTLFIVVSKSFTTTETLINAERVKAKLAQQKLPIEDHFIAITADTQKAKDWGLVAENILPMWDWVGGRFSVWSAVGLVNALCYGFVNFRAFLHGAYLMDQHFVSADYMQNMPIMMALLSYAQIQYFATHTHAILPYSYRLRDMVSHIQQLTMESLGKGTSCQGEALEHKTGPIIWGATGTHAQHTFSQLIHQGTHRIPADFILLNDGSANAQALRKQCLAQSQTMAYGDPDNKDPHRRIKGNQAHNIIELDKLDPAHMGALLALYEHKITVLGHLLNVNPFDQFGVEHSKRLLTTS